MAKESQFNVFLSGGELLWLASYLGNGNLPLLGIFFKNRFANRLREDMQRGFESLQTRDLLRPRSKGLWDVDGLVTALVQMVTAPEYAFLVSYLRQLGEGDTVYFFFKNRTGLTVTYKENFFRLSLYKDSTTLTKTLCGWMGISPGQTLEKAAPIDLGTLNLTNLLPMIWKQSDLTADVLATTDLSEKDVIRLAEPLSKLTFLSSLIRFSFQAGSIARQASLTFLGNTSTLWVNENRDAQVTSLVVEPILPLTANNLVTRYMRPDPFSAEGPEPVNESLTL